MSGDRRGQPLSAFARKILKLNRESPLLMPPGVTRGGQLSTDPYDLPLIRSVAEFFSATKHSGIQVCEAVNSIRRIASNSPVFVADR